MSNQVGDCFKFLKPFHNVRTLTNERQNTISKTARRMEQTVSKFALPFLKPITAGNVYIRFVFSSNPSQNKKGSNCRIEFEKYKTARKQIASNKNNSFFLKKQRGDFD